MVNGDVFVAKTADKFLGNLKLLAKTTDTLEQISTKVLNAPIGSLRWTSCGLGQAGASQDVHLLHADHQVLLGAKVMIAHEALH